MALIKPALYCGVPVFRVFAQHDSAEGLFYPFEKGGDSRESFSWLQYAISPLDGTKSHILILSIGHFIVNFISDTCALL